MKNDLTHSDELLLQFNTERMFLAEEEEEEEEEARIVVSLLDITDRKRAEETLRESEEQFRSVWENSRDGMRLCDVNGNIVRVNQAFCQMVGKTITEMEGKPLSVIYSPETGEHILARHIERFQSDSIVPSFEHQMTLHDGRTVWFGVSNSMIEIEGRKLQLSIFRDITDRKRAEEALRESEEKYHTLFTSSRDAIMILKPPSWKFASANQATAEMFKFKNEDEFLSFGPEDLSPERQPDGRASAEKAKEMNETAIREGFHSFEWTHKRLNGEEFLVTVLLTRMELAGEMVLQATVRDITERKQAEEALRESEEKYRLLVENAHDGIEITQHDRIMFANAQFAEMLGYTPAEIIDMKFSQIFTEQSIRELYERQKNRESGKPEPYQYETTFLKKDGTIIDVEARYRIIDYNGEPATFAIIRDITERLSAEKARKQAEEALITTERIYRQAITKAGGVPYQIDYASRNYVFLGDGIESLTGYLPDEMTGLLFTSRLRQTEAYGEYKDLPRLKRDQLTLQGKIKEWREDDLFERKDGSLVWLADHSVPLFDNEGRTTGSLGILMDITERKQVEEEIRKYKMAMECSHESIFITQVDGTIIYVNPAFERFYGYSADEVVGKTPRVIKSGLMSPEQYHKFWDSLLARQTLAGEIINKTKDGRLVTVYASDNPILDAEGKLVGFMSIQTDLTDRKRAEKKISMLAQALKSIGECVSITDMEDRVLYVNETFCKTYGYTEDELLGKVISMVRSPHNPPEIMREILPATIRCGWRGELLNLRKDSSEFPIFLSTSVIHDDNGQPIALICVATDITERKRAEERIRYQAYLLQNVFDAVIASDADGRIQAWNNAAERTYGWKAEEVLGQKFHDIMQPEYSNQSREEVFVKIDRDGIWSGEMMHHRKDGKTVAIQSTISVLKDTAGNYSGRVSVNHDITERLTAEEAIKQAEKERQTLEAQLQHAQKLESLGTLVSGIAHDFNNILAVILGHASLIEMGGVQTERLANSLQAIQKAGQRGAALVKQLLTFARKTEPSLHALSINQIIEELMKLLAETFPKTIEVKTKFRKVPFILGDPDQLYQVILNLCVNARDAMPDGGSLTIQTDTMMGDAVHSLLPQASATEYVRIEVSDTGTGMSEATIKRVFDPFFTTKERGKGTGLGLSIVYGIVTDHHGFILVNSALGKGTTFIVFLPVPQGAESLEASTNKADENIAGGNETILIVEDEEMVMNFLQEVLEKKGYKVLTAVNGKAGLETYREQGSKIDLIISDIGLPLINGINLFERLIVANPEVKVIIVSGYIEVDKKSDLLSRGLKAFIQKPCKPTEVWTRVREALDQPPSTKGKGL